MEATKALEELSRINLYITETIKQLEDTQEQFIQTQMSEILDCLEEAAENIAYLSRPILAKGILGKKDGNYYIDDHCLSYHDVCEIFYEDEWIKTILTTINSKPVFENLGDADLTGLLARVRKSN